MFGPIITLLIMLVIYAVNGVYPFGSFTVAFGDGMAQYVPFLTELTEQIKEGGSLLYTWHAGRGADFWSIIAYYLASPFNVIALFFGRENMTDAFSLISLLKYSCVALTFSVYLKNTYKKNDILITIFSVLWTFSSFLFSIICFTTWIDAIIYFPLVLLGLQRMMDGKSAWIYSLFLGLAIASNFYIGWMICIFCVIYFVFLLISDDDVYYEGVVANSEEVAENGEQQSVNIFDTFKNSFLLGSFFKFVSSSLLAGGLSAIFTMPTYMTLQNTTKGLVGERETPFNISDVWAVITSNVLPISDPHYSFNTYNYLFCFVGFVSLILVVAYFFTKSISLKKKIGAVFLLVIMIISYTFHPISFIWHGFGEPAGLAYRFAFIYSFVLLKIAYETFTNIKKTSVIGIIAGAVISLACLSGLYFSHTMNFRFFTWTFAGTIAAFIIGYTILLILKKNEKMEKAVSYIILVGVIAETLIFNINGLNVSDMTENYSEFSEVKKATEYLKSGEYLAFAPKTNHFEEMLMYGMMFGYNSTEMYSSMADGHYSLTLSELGSYGNRTNAQNGAQEQTPIFNVFFPNKYYLDGTGRLKENEYRKLIYSENGFSLFENNFTMPFMYTISPNIANWDPFGFFNIVDNENDSLKNITGYSENIATKNESKNFEFDNCEYISNVDKIQIIQSESEYHEGHDIENIDAVQKYLEEELIRFSCRITDKTKPAYVSFDSIAQSDGLMYLYVDTSEFTDMYVTVNGIETYYNIIAKGETRVYEIANVNKGDVIGIKIGGCTPQKLENNNVYLQDISAFSIITFTIDMDKFESAYNKLDAMSDTEMLEFEDTYVKAKVTSYEDGILYIPTAYDEGWTITIDGEEVPLYEHESHILMTEISKGEHIVEMKYIPQGFIPGAVITGVSVLILIAWAVISTKRFKKEQESDIIVSNDVNEE